MTGASTRDSRHRTGAVEIISSAGRLSASPLPDTAGAPLVFHLDAAPGLYRLSAVLDAKHFDWERLYEVLNQFGNVNARTGPWDFSIKNRFRPLVPSYWVTVNGRRIGLWFFQRVSLEDLRDKRFRGRTAFRLDGPATISLTPYCPEDEPVPSNRWAGLKWAGAWIEPDPEDTLEPLPPGIRDARTAPAAQWAAPEFWRRMDALLQGPAAHYRDPVHRAADWLVANPHSGADSFAALVALARLGVAPAAMDMALAAVDRLLAAPAWGSLQPDAYSHNGDMGAMGAIRSLAWAWHTLPDELGSERRARVLARLRTQGDIFIEQALLNRDYWGGSVLQDHGWRSMFGFAAAALHLLGVVPEAERWLSCVLPRVRRSLAAMPRDGALTPAIHHSLFNYMHEVTQFRDALLTATGEDIFDQPQFPAILDYLAVTATPFRRADGDTPVSLQSLHGANHFLNRMAAKYRSPLAAGLERRLHAPVEGGFYPPSSEARHYAGLVEGLLSWQPEAPPPAWPAVAPFLVLPDAGEVHWRREQAGVRFSVQCGPETGHNAYRLATGPCDRIASAPGAGHFRLLLDGALLCGAAQYNYRLLSCQKSCLLIDGAGQYGDIGYPMTIPSKRHRGECIETVRWDPVKETGFVRLALQPAYPEELGVLHYSREFHLTAASVVVRDTIALDAPRRLSWLFQGPPEMASAVALVPPLAARFGLLGCIRITADRASLPLSASIHETPIVWTYGGQRPPTAHVRYDALHAVPSASVDFVLTWQRGPDTPGGGTPSDNSCEGSTT